VTTVNKHAKGKGGFCRKRGVAERKKGGDSSSISKKKKEVLLQRGEEKKGSGVRGRK